MTITQATPAIASATALLALFMWLCGTVTTYVRGRAMQSPNAEDAAVMRFFNLVFLVKGPAFQALPGNDENDAATNRWLRITANNTANIPPALLVFVLADQTGALAPALLAWLVWIFTAARLAHTLFYALALQPLRTASYSLAALCMMIAAAGLLVRFAGG